MDDYYSILELNKNCSKEDIKKKYHRLSLKYHPDKNEGGNSERFRRITDAYKILYDDDRRKLYDIKLLFKDIDLTEEDYHLLCSYYNSFIHSNEYKLMMLLYKSIPKTVKELDLLSQDAFLQSAHRGQKVGKIAIAYTVWSTKKGGGKLIVKEVFKVIKKSNHLNRLVTLSPLTDMARKFHLRNGAEEIQVNESTQNFEYKIIK